MKVPLRRGGAAAELCGPAAFFDAWSDAWPDGLSEGLSGAGSAAALRGAARAVSSATPSMICGCAPAPSPPEARSTAASMAMLLRSEEHTSELQSLMRISYAVFCLKTKQK